MWNRYNKKIRKMNISDAFIIALATMFSGLLMGLAYLIYQHKFIKDGI